MTHKMEETFHTVTLLEEVLLGIWDDAYSLIPLLVRFRYV